MNISSTTAAGAAVEQSAAGRTDAPALVPWTGAQPLVPGLDQTRTVGLVTLPGAFVGVLLGGGTPLQAGAAQVLVLVGLLAAQTITVVVAHRLIRSARLLPDDGSEARTFRDDLAAAWRERDEILSRF